MSLPLNVALEIIAQINMTRAALSHAGLELGPRLRAPRSLAELRDALGAAGLAREESSGDFFAAFEPPLTNSVIDCWQSFAGTGRSYRPGEPARTAFAMRLPNPLAEPRLKLPAMLNAFAARLPEERVEGCEPCPDPGLNFIRVVALVNKTRAHVHAAAGEAPSRPLTALPLTRAGLAATLGAEYLDGECPCHPHALVAVYPDARGAEAAAAAWRSEFIPGSGEDGPAAYLPEELARFALALPREMPGRALAASS